MLKEHWGRVPFGIVDNRSLLFPKAGQEESDEARAENARNNKGSVRAVYVEYLEGKGGNNKPDAQYAEVSAKSSRVTLIVILLLHIQLEFCEIMVDAIHEWSNFCCIPPVVSTSITYAQEFFRS